MHVGVVVVHGEHIFHVVFIGKDVNHPTEYHREKGAAFSLAGFFRMDGAEHAEFRMVAKVFLDFLCRGAQKFVCSCQRAMLSGIRWFS